MTPPALLRGAGLRFAPHVAGHVELQLEQDGFVDPLQLDMVGQPFYSGYGITVDVSSFAEIPRKVPETLAFRPNRERIAQFLHAAMQRCVPGAPVLVDRSPENARALAASLEAAARSATARASVRAVGG
jgi:hypothetical protein